MKILGIQKDHNSSACLYIDGELVYYNQEERLSRIKKDSGLPIKTLQEICKICSEIDVLLVSGYDSILADKSIVGIIKKLGFSTSKIFEFVPYYKSHHLMHAAKAFYNSNFENALVMVCDGRGSTYNLSNGYQAHETTSIFSASYPNKFDLIYRRFFTTSKIDSSTKVIWDNNPGIAKIERPSYLTRQTIVELRNDLDVGLMYEATSRALNFNDEGGKMMGLQSYGSYDAELPTILYDDQTFNMNIFKYDRMENNRGFDTLKYTNLQYIDKRTNFAFAIQKTFEKINFKRIETYLEKTNHKNLVITGGTGLNVVANTYFRKKLPDDINMYVEPVCGDEGNCIGICEYYIREKTKSVEIKKPMSIYIGGTDPSYDYKLLENEIEIPNATPSIVAEILKAGHLVSIFHGKSEAGPRALGNRSILFDPRVKNGKDFVNRVKNREKFRPFAAAVLLEKANEWFDLDKIIESPHMMYAVDVKEDKIDLIPAVVHVDGSCRIQTLTKEQNVNVYNLVKCFFEKTNIPMLLNTSFNLAGDPIVETIDDALNSLRKSQLEYLYLPDIEKLIYIKN